jgi:phage FluMu protein Com
MRIAMSHEPQYRCETCNQLFTRRELVAGAWGDPCCPNCKTSNLVRHRTRIATILGAYFLFKVY